MAKEAGPQINWVGAAGSGLGSVTSAVLLSTTGAAGTWIGAGIGTFIITVGGAIYAYYLHRAKTGIEKTADKVKQVGSPAKKKVQQDTTSITAQRDPNQPATADAAAESAEHTGSESIEHKAKPTFTEALQNIRWKRVAGLAAGLFALTMAIIFIFELATGRPVSSYTGGSSPDSTGTSITGVQDPAAPAEEDPEQVPGQQDEQLEQPGEVVPEEGPEQAPEIPEDNVPPPVEPEPVPEQPAPQPQNENVEAPQ